MIKFIFGILELIFRKLLCCIHFLLYQTTENHKKNMKKKMNEKKWKRVEFYLYIKCHISVDIYQYVVCDI